MRITYRALKREFGLDEDALEDLKSELIDAQRVATDEEGKVLVWTGDSGAGSAPSEAQVVFARHEQVLLPRVIPPFIWPSVSVQNKQRWKPAAATDGERKTITALFADLKGSTALIEGLDPEEARAIIDPALAADDGRRASV